MSQVTDKPVVPRVKKSISIEIEDKSKDRVKYRSSSGHWGKIKRNIKTKHCDKKIRRIKDGNFEVKLTQKRRSNWSNWVFKWQNFSTTWTQS